MSAGADQPLQKLLADMVDRKTFNVDLGFTAMPDEAFTAPRPPQNNGVQPRDRYCEGREVAVRRAIATTSLDLKDTGMAPLGARDTLRRDHFVVYKGDNQAAPFQERREAEEPIAGEAGSAGAARGAPSGRAQRHARAGNPEPQSRFSTTTGDAYSGGGQRAPATSAAQRQQRAWELERDYAVEERRKALGRELRSRRLESLRGSSISFAYSRPGEYYPDMVRATPTTESDPSRASEEFECGKRLDQHAGQLQVRLGGEYTMNDLAAERLHMRARAPGEFKPKKRDYDIAAPLRHIDTSAHERNKTWSVTRTGPATGTVGAAGVSTALASTASAGTPAAAPQDQLHAPRRVEPAAPSVSRFPPPSRPK